MDTARLFQFGRSQAVRLPKAYRCSGRSRTRCDGLGSGLNPVTTLARWSSMPILDGGNSILQAGRE
jgi:hypothetical protein